MTLGVSARFAEETEIHGIAHLARAKNACEKSIWVTVVIAALILTILGVTRTIVEYIQQPVVTIVSYEPLPYFPSFTFCPDRWVNETKAREIGLDEHNYKNFGQLLNAPFGYGEGNESSEDQEKFKEKFGGFEMDKIIQKVSFDTDKFIHEVSRPGKVSDSGSFQMSLELKARQPCVMLASDLQFEPISGEHVMLILISPEFPSAFNFNPSSPYVVLNEIYIGDDAISVSPQFPTLLAANCLYHINVRAVKTKLHPSRPKGGCQKHSNQRMHIQCVTESTLYQCKNWGGGTLYVPGKNTTVGELMEAPCNLSAVNEQGVRIDQVVKERCQRPCEEWNYEVTTTYLGETKDGTNLLIIKVSKPEQSMSIEEVKTTTGGGFMSKLGGQIALYTGASFVTLIHVIMFVVSPKRVQPGNS